MPVCVWMCVSECVASPLHDALQCEVSHAVGQPPLPQLHVPAAGHAGKQHNLRRTIFTPAPRVGAKACSHTHTHRHTHKHKHTHTQTHTQVQTHICMDAHIHMRTHKNTHTHKKAHTHARTQTYTHTHTHPHTHTHTHVAHTKMHTP